MEKPNLIGVVTVTYNSASVISGFMDSLLNQTHSEFVLYAVDNASSDGTLRKLSEYQDARVVVITNSLNVGVAEGNNIGIQAALKDGCVSVLLINNDTIFESDLLSKLDQALHFDKSDIVVPKILFFDDPGTIWSAGGYFSRFRGISRHIGCGRRDDGRFDRARVVTYSPTCCMLIKKEVFDRTGFMDANYFVYYDDTDFCYRAYSSGFSLYYLPSARLLHKVSSLTRSSGELFATRYCMRNQVYFLLKNFPLWQAWFCLLTCQIYICAKLILAMYGVKVFWITEIAFWEGISLFRSRVGNPDKAGEPAGSR